MTSRVIRVGVSLEPELLHLLDAWVQERNSPSRSDAVRSLIRKEVSDRTLADPNADALGPRFPDMSEAYSRAYREIAKEVAAELCVYLPECVYAAMLGPSYETPAEIRFLRTIGADIVGMSTVPEVIVANHMGMKVLAVSCVTNMAAGILPQKINHEEVLEAGEMVRETLVKFLKALLPRLVAANQ